MITNNAQTAVNTRLITQTTPKTESEINTILSISILADDLLKDEAFIYFILNRKLEITQSLEALEYTQENDHQRVSLSRELVALRNLVGSINSASSLGKTVRNRKAV